MRIKEESLEYLYKKGIYSITNKNGKRYIGSTKQSFMSRFIMHAHKLRSGNHQNNHLQSAWKIDGIVGFTFEVLEVLEDRFEEREKHWIEEYSSWDRSKGYNINRDPNIAPSHTRETRDKISATLRKRYASGEISLNKGNWEKGSPPWNKGTKYDSTAHLKGVRKGTGRRAKVHDKSDKLLGKPEEVNQQPITSLND